MKHIDKQILITLIEIVLIVGVGIVAWLFFGAGIGALFLGILLLVLMWLNAALFDAKQEWVFVIFYGFSSWILSMYGVWQLTSGNAYSGLFIIITAIVIFFNMFYVFWQTIS